MGPWEQRRQGKGTTVETCGSFSKVGYGEGTAFPGKKPSPFPITLKGLALPRGPAQRGHLPTGCQSRAPVKGSTGCGRGGQG